MTGRRRWLAVHSHIHGEERAALNLRRQGFDVYLPRVARRRRHARKSEIVSRPLFPRYLFAGICVERGQWRPIISTPGVSSLVWQGDEPAVVDEAIIGHLRAREDDTGHVVLDETPPWLPGDPLRICAGAFNDCTGLFAGHTDHDRVSVLLELLGRKVRVSVEAALVTAA